MSNTNTPTESNSGMKKKLGLGCLGLLIIFLLIGIFADPVNDKTASDASEGSASESRESPPVEEPQYIASKDGLAITAFEWKQQDSSQNFDYSVSYKNIGRSDVDGASVSFTCVYEDGSESGSYRFSFDVCSICKQQVLGAGASLNQSGNFGIPHSWRIKKIVRDIKLSIDEVD